MKHKNSKRRLPIFTYLVLGFWTFISLFPLYFMLTFSLKSNKEIFGENIIGLPREWLWSNYEAALTTGNMLKYFFNSFIVTGCTIALTLMASLMASYALTRLIWKGRKTLNQIFMLGLTVPIHAAILPVFIMLRNLRMTNSYQALIIPYTAFALAMAIMICESFIENIPVELEEAACMDGCGVYRIFFQIILPLMKPAFSTIAIFTFLQAWNELMFAVIFISDSNYRTLSVGIQTLSGSYTTEWGPIGAALVIATFPTLLIYIFMSKKIQDSLIAGAVKG
ncbi:carbohydrate ABC transporter permease [Candidatus Galacturonibacter soehngenii]|uniref:Carbohydrate ABC transporter permease n=1 Tax=Candidatus Galacturonatibacter soehngenii TaxID=2307010 RepID=A0A7V7QMY3_9FIRM|nr:carbohydrate ABC transporter permease [Candidatus Galacturonibacter soehngenii]KAB1439698.1 carbohydrate ABC transporter permease [Candidatus Galacturonibacter soehngenii]